MEECEDWVLIEASSWCRGAGEGGVEAMGSWTLMCRGGGGVGLSFIIDESSTSRRSQLGGLISLLLNV